MKKLFTLFLCLIASFGALAQTVSREQAYTKALAFAQSHGFAPSSPYNCQAAKRAPGVKAGNDESEYYVFNMGDANDGFVIVSGDERTPNVLGYSTTGYFESNSIPDNMKAWLEGYAHQIQFIRTNNARIVSAKAQDTDDKTIIPEMMQTKWGQWWPYNDKSPKIEGSQAPTGCVATSMAQLLYYQYQQHPSAITKQLTQTIPDYTLQYNGNTYTINGYAAGSSIDWDNILPKYDTLSVGAFNDTQKNAVANLISYCGTAVAMQYGPSSSGSDDGAIPQALINYFGFDKSVQYVMRDNYSHDDWYDLIYNELKNHRVVAYSGNPICGNGHAFIIDGYAGDDYFYVNWGWDGAGDGAYLLDALNMTITDSGEGNRAEGYDLMQGAIIYAGLEQVGLSNLGVKVNNYSVEGSTIGYSIWNNSQETNTFTFGLGLKDSTNNIAQVIGETYNTTLQPRGLSTYETWDITEPLKPLGYGKYKIVPVGKISDTDSWQNLWSPSKYIQAEVDENGNVSLVVQPYHKLSMNNITLGNVKLKGQPLYVTMDIANTGTEDYNGPIYLMPCDDNNSMITNQSSVKYVNIPKGENKVVTISWIPKDSGNVKILVCDNSISDIWTTNAGIDGDFVIDKFEVTIGNIRPDHGTSLYITDLTVENADLSTTQIIDDNRLLTKVVGSDTLYAWGTIWAREEVLNKLLTITVFKFDDTSQTFKDKVYSSYRNLNLEGPGNGWAHGTTFGMSTKVIPGRYLLLITVGTPNNDNKSIKDTLWYNDTYCYEFDYVPSGINKIANNGKNISVSIYTLHGILIGRPAKSDAEDFLKTLPKGIYIVNGKKVVN